MANHPNDRRVLSPGFDPRIERERLRDVFAGRAMEGLLADLPMIEAVSKQRGLAFGDCVGEIAYEVADGMLRAKERRGE